MALEANRLEEPLELPAFPRRPDRAFPQPRRFRQPGAARRDHRARQRPRHRRPSTCARMFEEQFTTKTAGRGTGLGLSIVRRLVVNAHGADPLANHRRPRRRVHDPAPGELRQARGSRHQSEVQAGSDPVKSRLLLTPTDGRPPWNAPPSPPAPPPGQEMSPDPPLSPNPWPLLS